MAKTSDKLKLFWICVLLVMATTAVYWQVHEHDFINFDDPEYVYTNPSIYNGLTSQSLVWAFTTPHGGTSYWHPLTWMSHMLDCQLYGLNPRGHHLTNLFFHIINALLLFWVFKKMTGGLWQSAFVAAAFALHPLHVESVAWISQRKDVLSTFCWILTMAAYLRYVKRSNAVAEQTKHSFSYLANPWYLLTLLVFAIGLMTKPMLITLPFVLLILDYWPLERFELGRGFKTDVPQNGESPNTFSQWRVLGRLFVEKIPFFILSVIISIITFIAQKNVGALTPGEAFSLRARILNAFISYVKYIEKTIWPNRLAVFYPHLCDAVSISSAVIAVLLLLAISVLILRLATRHKYLPAGWLWYLGTLVPVIGLVQAGGQAMADRYTYMSLTGLFVITAWGLTDISVKWRYRKTILTVSAAAALLALSICTHLQLQYWRNTKTLFDHALDITDENYMAHICLAEYFVEQDQLDQAVNHNLEILRIKPDHTKAHNNLGVILALQSKFDQAIEHFNEVVKIDPNIAETYNNLGYTMVQQSKFSQAITYYTKALQIEPDHIRARGNIADAHNALGIAFYRQRKLDEAVKHFTQVLHFNPDHVGPMNTLAWLLATRKKADFYDPQEAIRLAKKACELSEYQKPIVMGTLAAAYAAAGDFPQAITIAEKALALARSADQDQLAGNIQKQLFIYKAGRPYIER